jgi:hypothetical protein
MAQLESTSATMAFHRAMINGVGVFYREADPMAHPDAVDTFMLLTTTEQRHTGGMSHPERYNPDIWTGVRASIMAGPDALSSASDRSPCPVSTETNALWPSHSSRS